MREIKFRGKGTDGQWWYGHFASNDKDSCIIETRDEKFVFHSVIPETVGQSTGLLDADGKEIYEGDVITPLGFDDVMMLVYWHNEIGAFYTIDPCDSEIFCTVPLGKELQNLDYRIVGNIH